MTARCVHASWKRLTVLNRVSHRIVGVCGASFSAVMCLAQLGFSPTPGLLMHNQILLHNTTCSVLFIFISVEVVIL